MSGLIVLRPALLYGLEMAALSRRHGAEDVKFFFWVGVRGDGWIRLNTSTSEELEGGRHLGDKEREATWRDFGHIEKEESEKKILELTGRRKGNRSKRKYVDVMKEDIE